VRITEVTTAAGWIAGLAIVAMIAAGWRKPARATADPARARRPARAPVGIPLAESRAPLYRPASLWRRLWALAASSAMALVTGALLATLVAFAMAYGVVVLSTMLKR
jgi:hypothetical protein